MKKVYIVVKYWIDKCDPYYTSDSIIGVFDSKEKAFEIVPNNSKKVEYDKPVNSEWSFELEDGEYTIFEVELNTLVNL